MAWGRRAVKEVEGVAERSGDEQCRRPTMTLIAQPIGDTAPCRRREIMPHIVFLITVRRRSREEQRHQPCEDRYGDPVVGGLHGTPDTWLATWLSRATAWHINWSSALPAAAAMLLSACHASPPTGQVIAVVDGVEITLAELNAEARARNLAIGSDRAQRDQAIADLVKRRLLVHAAEARGLDRVPAFILAERRARDILLAQELVTVRLAETDRQDANAAQRSAPETADQRQQRLAGVGQARSDRVVAQILSSEQRTADIQYQCGFAPGRTIR